MAVQNPPVSTTSAEASASVAASSALTQQRQTTAQALRDVSVLIRTSSSSAPSQLLVTNFYSISPTRSHWLVANPSRGLLLQLCAYPSVRAFSATPKGQEDAAKTKSVATPNESTAAVVESTNARPESRAAALWKHIKHEAQHYWLGTKLLGKEVGISAGIVQQILRGEELTRREYRQLRNTSADLLKMIPFAVFILVPFMEAFLPLALWLFPGMLPSTFQQEWKKEDEMKRKLKARIEVARFLQDAVDEMANNLKKKSDQGGTAAEFTHFMAKVQNGDARVTNEQIVRFSKLFNDDITLDSVGRLQLVNLCRLLEMPTFGSDSMLKFQLLQRMRAIKADDEMIHAEGVNELTLGELREALAYRGMRSVGLSKEAYAADLEGWLDLSLRKAVPTTLLLMSRAFKITQTSTAEDALKDTLQAMPKAALDSAESMAAEPDKVLETQRKLAELQREQELIVEEKKEKEALAVAQVHAAATRLLKEEGAGLVAKAVGGEEEVRAAQAAARALDAAARDQHALHQEADAKEEPRDGALAVVVTGTGLGRWESAPELKLLRERFMAAEKELLAAMREALQPRFKVELKESRYSEVLRQELFAQQDALLNLLLAPPTPAPAIGEGEQGGEGEEGLVGGGEGEEEGKKEAGLEEAPAKVDVQVIASVAELLMMLGSKDATGEEKELINTIKEHRLDIRQELTALGESNADAKKSSEAKAANRLVDKMDGIIARLEAEVTQVSGDIGAKLKLIDVDEDGVISAEEVRMAVQATMQRPISDAELAAVIAELDTDRDGRIQMHEVADIAHGLARARHDYIWNEEGGAVDKPHILNKALEELDDEETVLWGSLLEEYRDKVREQKAMLAQQKRVERDLAAKDEAAKSNDRRGLEEEWKKEQEELEEGKPAPPSPSPTTHPPPPPPSLPPRDSTPQGGEGKKDKA